MDKHGAESTARAAPNALAMIDPNVLLAELTCGDDSRAEVAAPLYAALGKPGLSQIENLLASKNMDERWWALRVLGQMQYPPFELLLNALLDDAPEIRQCAALGLCYHPDAHNVSGLAAALADPDALTASLASNALAAIGKAATSALIDALENGKQPAKIEALRALAFIKDPNSIPALMKTIQKDSAVLQYWANKALNDLGLGMMYFKPN